MLIINIFLNQNNRNSVVTPLRIKTIPPTKSTVLNFILLLIQFPIWTAPAVHIKWPKQAPNVTKNTLYDEAKAIVANWDLSPHYAKNDITNAFPKTNFFGNLKSYECFIWAWLNSCC